MSIHLQFFSACLVQKATHLLTTMCCAALFAGCSVYQADEPDSHKTTNPSCTTSCDFVAHITIEQWGFVLEEMRKKHNELQRQLRDKNPYWNWNYYKHLSIDEYLSKLAKDYPMSSMVESSASRTEWLSKGIAPYAPNSKNNEKLRIELQGWSFDDRSFCERVTRAAEKLGYTNA